MPTTKDLLQLAVSGDVIGFTKTYSEIMDEKIADAVEVRKLEIADSIYDSEEVVEQFEDEDLDESLDHDLDLEDLDIDIDIDAELEIDEDLEELEDND